MNDRELLELAAKAAGITGGWGEVHALPQGEVDCTDLWFLESDDQPYVWNPLTDDGDALRLAVKLRLDILQDTSFVSIKQWCAIDAEARDLAYERVDEDRLEVTRRAIVIAAAEIGRTMP